MLAGFFLGCLDTASNSLVLYMLGPLRSPPFTQSLHAMVALGFTLGSLIIRPFLPEEQEDNSQLCNVFAQNETINETHNGAFNTATDIVSDGSTTQTNQNIPNLIWPFSIICSVHIICCIGYLCLGKIIIIHNNIL